MRVNTTKQKLAEGKAVFGGIVGENAPSTIEVLGAIGYDFVMIDCEHGPMTLSEVEGLVRAAEAFGITPLARVPDHEPATILRFLDRGIQGVIVPHVNTAEEAEAVARAARYYPEGERGLASTRAHDYNVGVSRVEATRWLNENVMVIPMVEEITAVRNLDAILKVPGIDVIHCAPADLAQSMGFPPDEEVQRVRREVVAKCVAAGIPVGLGGNSPNNPAQTAEFVRQGARFVTVPALSLLQFAARQFRAQVEAALAAEPK
ncbi:MAG TPA: aldolase/citrate lyase family protein [Dehalococcoidia bacterium]|nr:aldolase/citrate lyase family protein [Dehalococcoidia bacterium]